MSSNPMLKGLRELKIDKSLLVIFTSYSARLIYASPTMATYNFYMSIFLKISRSGI